MTSPVMVPVRAAADRFVEEHLPLATALGRRLADDLDDAAAFVRTAEAGFASLADPRAREGLPKVAPGIGPILGVRNPLLDAVDAALLRALRGVPTARLVPAADALAHAELRELRWLAIRLLGAMVVQDPELAWQVFRQIARQADDWITVDTLAGFIAPAILREPFRWAELEQLVYSPSPWERRLVGATIASMTLRRHAALREPDSVSRAFALIELQMGDRAPDVQKALGWALRNLLRIDLGAVTACCERETELAVRTRDGHRAWVLRDVATRLEPATAARIRSSLAGIRRASGSPSTSRASATAAAFMAAGRADRHADHPRT
jgi:3-methyladenine DNA glycosylase AlkD